MATQDHWRRVYSSKAPDTVSWYQPSPRQSLDLIQQAGLSRDAHILDVGGGASFLVDELLDAGFHDVSVLDVAEEPMDIVRRRLGERAAGVEWISADITGFRPDRQWDLWHDRAVFHFLVDEEARAGYRCALSGGLAPGGHVVVATFGPDGPPKCSGLPVERYDAAGLEAALGCDLALQASFLHDHQTPGGGMQQFLHCRFVRQE